MHASVQDFFSYIIYGDPAWKAITIRLQKTEYKFLIQAYMLYIF
jgi:hypothetical protein